jgi:hypothetical protein
MSQRPNYDVSRFRGHEGGQVAGSFGIVIVRLQNVDKKHLRLPRSDNFWSYSLFLAYRAGCDKAVLQKEKKFLGSGLFRSAFLPGPPKP